MNLGYRYSHIWLTSRDLPPTRPPAAELPSL